MNSLSNFGKWGIIWLCLLLCVSSSFAQLVYNPDTWTYTNDGEVIEQDDIWIPVEDEVVEVDDTTGTSDTSSASENDLVITAEGDVEWIPVDEDEGIEEEPEGDAEEIVFVPVEDVELIAFDENDPIITVTEQTSTLVADVAVDDLEGMLSEAIGVLWEYLDQNASSLASVYNDNISARYGTSFSDILSCIGDDNAIAQIQNEIQNIVTTLDTRIKSDSTSIFSQIATLKYQNSLDLVNDDALAIETRVIATNIDAFNQNFISLIDYYVQQSTASILEFIATEEASDYEALLASYLKRKTLVDQLKQAFTAFEKGSFFSQTVVGPRADELEDLANEIFQIFENDMEAQWSDRDPVAYQAMLSQMRTAFDVKVRQAIDELFPNGNIDRVYASYTSLADIYGINKDVYNCQAVISNDTIDTAGPTLIWTIDDIQQTLAIASSSVWGAQSFEELKVWLSDILLNFYQTDLLAQSKIAFDNADIIVLTEEQKLRNLYITQVKSFLLNMRLDYIDNDRLSAFESKLQRAITRINGAIDDGAEGNLLLILQSIRAAAQQVLGQ